MLVMETISKIRRAFFVQGKAIKAICRELGVSRKVVRKVIRSGSTEFRYEREDQPLPKIGRWRDTLDQLLLANEGKTTRERLPFAKGQVGGDDDRGPFVEPADEVEEELAAGLGEGQVTELVEDNEVHTGEVIGEPTLPTAASLGLEPVDEIYDIVEPAASAGADAASRDRDGEMSFAGACSADQGGVALLGNEAAAGELGDESLVSRAEPTETQQPAVAPSPQPRPAPTGRPLPPKPRRSRESLLDADLGSRSAAE
jgi:hypothetical protein